jgi:hypothetical protein
MNKWQIILILIFLILPGHLILCQNNRTITLNNDSLLQLRQEIIRLRQEQQVTGSKLDSLISDLARKEKDAMAESEMQKLLDEAEHLSVMQKEREEDISRKFHSGTRQQQGLNPNISLGGDFFGAVSSSQHDLISEPGDVSYGNNGFYMREIEIGMVAPLDPFTRGKAFISVTKQAISIEEAYMEWLNLPLKMNLKIGIFYAEFGLLNRYHDHALPQFDRPRALVNLFSNGGLEGTGFASSFMLPELIFADASTLDITVVRGPATGENFSFADNSFLYIGQFKNFYDLNEDSFFEIRISGTTGRNPAEGTNRSYVGSLGFNYKWVPMGREKYRTFDWKTEFLFSYRDENTGSVKSKGFYTSVQDKLNARWWLGGRIGYSELPYDQSQQQWDFTINLDFWQSEFVFTRLQYQYNRRSIESTDPDYQGSLPDDHSLILQVCWAMGPHKHEAY